MSHVDSGNWETSWDSRKGSEASGDSSFVLGVVLAVSLVVPITLSVLTDELHMRGLIGRLLTDSLQLFSAVTVGAGMSYVLWNVTSARRVRYTCLLASLLVIASQIINLSGEFAFSRDMPILASDSELNITMQNALLYAGFGMFLASLGLAVLDGNRSRRLLHERQKELLQEIAERERIEAALRDSEEKYRLIFDGANDGIALVGRDMRPLMVNQRLYDMLGYPPGEISAAEAVDLIHPDDRERLAENNRLRLAGESVPRTYEFRMRHQAGHFVHIEGSFDLVWRAGKVIGSQGILRDVTERHRQEEEQERLQTQFQQAQKLESLGVLAGGIAHDFNNLLMGVLGNASLALLELPADSPVRKNIERIERAGQRAADLSKQMLAYSGKGRFIIQPISLTTLVEEMVHLLKVSISKKVDVVYQLDADAPLVEGDPTQVGQVILNLITNASEAIGDQSGVITVKTGVAEMDRASIEETYFHENLEGGRYAYLEVSDTGPGIDPETVKRIFDPFFTTKFMGRGLGLAAVMGIVRGHNGTIRVTSTLGKGTTFVVLFPCTDARVAAPPQAPTRAEPWRGEGSVLVVDDEETVLDVAKQVLEDCGFDVLTARDGKEAVEIFGANSERIVLVLLDLTIPLMGGYEAYDEIRRIREDAVVVLSSGYDESEAAARFAGKGLAGFIQKPYRVQELVNAVREVLEGAPSREGA